MVISRMNFPVACDFLSEATSRFANNHCLPICMGSLSFEFGLDKAATVKQGTF
jgi:hypothetical protein